MAAPLALLADFAASTRLDALPSTVIARMRACLLYGLAVAIATARAPTPRIACSAFPAPDGAGEATRLLDGARLDAANAAWCNGVLLHARVQDDAHPCGHMGAVLVSAALALGEARGASGADLLAALASGYETALRIGRDQAAVLSARGFRTTSTYGAFGAAAAAARLMGLDARATGEALALAANHAAGLREFVDAGSEDYAYQAGFAARNGIEAARLAAAGARGPASALDGAAGFYRAFGDGSGGERLTQRLGEEFELLRIAYKPFPVCQFHRGTIGLVLDLRQRAAGSALTRLTLRMHPFEADFFGVRLAGPFATFAQTFMSAPFCAATAWVHGDVTYAALNRFDDSAVNALAAQVAVHADPARARYEPEVIVELADGRVLVAAEFGGEARYALTWEVACMMTERLCGEACISPTLARRLVDGVAGLEHGAEVATLVRTVAEAVRDASDCVAIG